MSNQNKKQRTSNQLPILPIVPFPPLNTQNINNELIENVSHNITYKNYSDATLKNSSAFIDLSTLKTLNTELIYNLSNYTKSKATTKVKELLAKKELHDYFTGNQVIIYRSNFEPIQYSIPLTELLNNFKVALSYGSMELVKLIWENIKNTEWMTTISSEKSTELLHLVIKSNNNQVTKLIQEFIAAINNISVIENEIKKLSKYKDCYIKSERIKILKARMNELSATTPTENSNKEINVNFDLEAELKIINEQYAEEKSASSSNIQQTFLAPSQNAPVLTNSLKGLEGALNEPISYNEIYNPDLQLEADLQAIIAPPSAMNISLNETSMSSTGNPISLLHNIHVQLGALSKNLKSISTQNATPKSSTEEKKITYYTSTGIDELNAELRSALYGKNEMDLYRILNTPQLKDFFTGNRIIIIDCLCHKIPHQASADQLLENFKAALAYPKLNLYQSIWQNNLIRDAIIKLDRIEAIKLLHLVVMSDTNDSFIQEYINWLDNIFVIKVELTILDKMPKKSQPSNIFDLVLMLGLRLQTLENQNVYVSNYSGSFVNNLSLHNKNNQPASVSSLPYGKKI